MKMLLKLNEEGTSILMVTHSATNAAFSGRIVSLLDGKIVSDKSAGQLRPMRNYMVVLLPNACSVRSSTLRSMWPAFHWGWRAGFVAGSVSLERADL